MKYFGLICKYIHTYIRCLSDAGQSARIGLSAGSHMMTPLFAILVAKRMEAVRCLNPIKENQRYFHTSSSSATETAASSSLPLAAVSLSLIPLLPPFLSLSTTPSQTPFHLSAVSLSQPSISPPFHLSLHHAISSLSQLRFLSRTRLLNTADFSRGTI